jgi:hypothetical protein
MIEHAVCQFSSLPEALPFCGPLVCPVDETVLGYPWALLPNRTGRVKGIRGFAPVSVSQWPPPGTPLWRNTTTNVTMTALDSSGRKFECWWNVVVPPLSPLGSATFHVRNGTYNETFRFVGIYDITGQVYKLKGRASNKVRGRGSSVGAEIRDSGHKQTGRKLTIPENKDRGAVEVPKVAVEFSDKNLSDITLDVHVTRNDQPNQLTFVAYGQESGTYGFLNYL